MSGEVDEEAPPHSDERKEDPHEEADAAADDDDDDDESKGIEKAASPPPVQKAEPADDEEEDEEGEEEEDPEKDKEDMIVEQPVVEDDPLARARAQGVLSHPETPSKNPCHCPDALFGMGWVVSMLVAIAICYDYGWTQYSELEYDDDDDEKKKENAVGNLAKVLISSLVVTFGISQVFASITLRLPGKTAIHAIFVATEIELVLTAAFAAQYNYWYTSLLLLLLAVFIVLYHANSIYSIDEASATMEVATKFLRASPGLECIAVLGSLIGTVLIFVTCLAVYALYHFKTSKRSEDRSALALAMFFLILIFFWTSQVLKWMAVTVTGGTAWYWWNDERPPEGKPANNALYRAWMFDLGAICFGAAFVSPVDVCVSSIRRTKAFADRYPEGLCASCLVSCCACFLGCCREGCDVVSPYNFTLLNTHGYSFLYAGKQVVSLFHRQGRNASDTEVFVDYAFFWNAVASGLIAAIFGLYMVIHGDNEFSAGTNHAEAITVFVGFFGGAAVSTLTWGMLVGANKSVALLFSDTPKVLAVTHPDQFATLATIWRFAPEALEAGSRPNRGSTYGSM